MRVTNNLMSNSVTDTLQRNFERIIELQNTVASGKKVSKPSDDPIGIGDALEFRTRISSIEQYGRNIKYGKSWLNITDATLGSIDNLLIRAKELAVYQASETASDTTRDIAAEELSNIYDQIMQLANTSSGGRYLFGGHQSDAAPYSRDAAFAATYAGDSGDIRVIIGESIDMAVNTSGDAVFDSDVNVFDVLRDLKNGLEDNDTTAIADQVDQLDTAMDQVLNQRAKVGARLNRLDATQNHWETFKLTTQELLNATEDADLVMAMTELQGMETAYQAALAATASVIQPNLMQFLR